MNAAWLVVAAVAGLAVAGVLLFIGFALAGRRRADARRLAAIAAARRQVEDLVADLPALPVDRESLQIGDVVVAIHVDRIVRAVYALAAFKAAEVKTFNADHVYGYVVDQAFDRYLREFSGELSGVIVLALAERAEASAGVRRSH